MGADPEGEPEPSILTFRQASEILRPGRIPLDVHGKRLYVEWDPYAPVTPLEQLVYFSQFLATAGLFQD